MVGVLTITHILGFVVDTIVTKSTVGCAIYIGGFGQMLAIVIGVERIFTPTKIELTCFKPLGTNGIISKWDPLLFYSIRRKSVSHFLVTWKKKKRW